VEFGAWCGTGSEKGEGGVCPLCIRGGRGEEVGNSERGEFKLGEGSKTRRGG